MNRHLRTLQTRLDRQAIDQLRAEVARLSALLDEERSLHLQATEDAEYWQSSAETWQRLADSLLDHDDSHGVGITKDGELCLVETPGFLRRQAT